MSANCPVPNNINPLSPTGFKLSINKLPDLSFFCQEVTLPSLQLPSVAMATPLSTIENPGEILAYGELEVNFIIDEDMRNYMGIHNWLVGLGHPEDFKQFTDFVSGQRSSSNYDRPSNAFVYSDASLAILGSNNSPVKSLQFVDLFPTALGSLNFQVNVTDINYLIGTATFKYTYYKFE